MSAGLYDLSIEQGTVCSRRFTWKDAGGNPIPLTGYTAEEALGRTPAELLRSDAHEPAFFEEIEAALNAGRTWSGRIVSRHKDGRPIHQDATISPVHDERAEKVRQAFRARAAGEPIGVIARRLGMTTSGVRKLFANRATGVTWR